VSGWCVGVPVVLLLLLFLGTRLRFQKQDVLMGERLVRRCASCAAVAAVVGHQAAVPQAGCVGE